MFDFLRELPRTKEPERTYRLEWGLDNTRVIVRFYFSDRGFIPGELPFTVIDAFRSENNSTVEPVLAKGHKEPSHDVLIMRLRERIDAQTKVMTEQFARIKELESKVEDLTK